MAENVVKNKIVIEGEAKYKQTLREIAQQLKEAKSEVKAASAEMKAQGQTTESVRGKLDALGSVYKAQTEQLQTMREHLEKVEAAYGANSREASELRTKINNLRAETSSTSGEMKTLEQQLDNMGDAAQGAKDDLQGLDSDLDRVGDAAGDAAGELEGLPGILENLGQGVEIGVGVSLGQGFASILGNIKDGIKQFVAEGIQEAIEDQQNYNNLGIQTGTLGTQMQDMMYEAVERFGMWMPKVGGDEANGFAASIWTRASGTDYVKDAQSMLDIMQATYAATQQTGQGFDQIAEGAKNMSAAFGSDFKDNVALIGYIGQSNAGAKGVDTLEAYAFGFHDLGMSADEAAGAIIAASDAGVDVSKMGRGIQVFDTWMEKMDGTTESAKKLGLYGHDLGKKYEVGAETAANAVDLVLHKLLAIEDKDLQNKLGEELFGSQSWDRYGTQMAQSILDGYGKEFTTEATHQNELAIKALTDDLDTQMAQSQQVFKEAGGDLMAPLVETYTGLFGQLNDAAQKAYAEGGGLDALGAWFRELPGAYMENVLKPAGEVISEGAGQLFELAGDALEDGLTAAAEKAPELVALVGDTLLDGLTTTEEEAAEKLVELRGEIEEALGAGDSQAANEAYERWEMLFGGLPPIIEDTAEKVSEADQVLGSAGGDAMQLLEMAGEALLDSLTTTEEEASAKLEQLRGDIEEGLSAGDSQAVNAALEQYEMLFGGLPDVIGEAAPAAQEAAEQVGQAVESGTEESLQAVVDRVHDLNDQIRMAYNMEDPILAENIKVQRDEALQEMMDLQARMTEESKAAGENLDTGFEAGAQGVTVTVEDTATGIIQTLEPFVPQVLQTGTELGIQLDEGFLAGAEPAPGDAEDTVDSVIAKLEAGIDRAYSAGRRTGEAYERGYKSALDQHSPSRVMQAAAEDTVEPIFRVMDAGEGEVYERAAALGEAVSGGYADTAGNGPVLANSGQAAAGLSIDPQSLAEAVRAALSGLGVYLDGRPVGELAEPYVSEATSRRAAGTVRGVSAWTKSW